MTNELPPCYGTFGRWFGHKFRGRYSVTEREMTGPRVSVKVPIEQATTENLRKMYVLQDSTYHHDVCDRCGLTINKRG